MFSEGLILTQGTCADLRVSQVLVCATLDEREASKWTGTILAMLILAPGKASLGRPSWGWGGQGEVGPISRLTWGEVEPGARETGSVLTEVIELKKTESAVEWREQVWF